MEAKHILFLLRSPGPVKSSIIKKGENGLIVASAKYINTDKRILFQISVKHVLKLTTHFSKNKTLTDFPK